MGNAKIATASVLVALVCGCPSVQRDAGSADRSDSASSESPAGESSRRTATKQRRLLEKVFSPQVARSGGRGFYTDDADDLRQELRGFLDAAEASNDLENRDLLGFLSPHAGYRYSGPTAATAYRQLQGRQYRTVVVMALSHRRRAPKISILDFDAYRTPLGPVRIDRALVGELIAAAPDLLEADVAMFRGEHSLEIQLPLLQLTLGEEVEIVPIIVGTGREEDCTRLARLLHEQLGQRRDVLFIASSDLTHHYPYDEAVELDRGILSLVTDLNVDGFRERGPLGREMPCGYYPLLTLMELTRLYDESARSATLLQYQNSGDTAGDRGRVVGYGAVAFSLNQGVRTQERAARPPPAPEAPEASGEAAEVGQFSRDERAALLELARRSVAAAVAGETHEPRRPDSEVLTAPGAAFVTLRCETESGRCSGRGEGLRGCIGHILARGPLFECVNSVARSAAIHDRRFPALTREEVGHLTYEISVLSAPEVVTDPSTIVVGRHGLIMSRDGRRGLLLPQVPIEWGWDRETFLARTCRKANMEATCWSDPRTRIERFGAIVWGEDLVAHDHY